MAAPRFLIDSHVHLMTPSRIKGGIKWIRRAVPAFQRLSLEVTREEIISHLKQAGVDYMINYFYPLEPGESRAINRWQYELARQHRFIIPFASLHPEDKDKEGIIREAFEIFDLAGFKFHPYIQRFEILDKAMSPVYELLEKRGCPVTFHTGFASFYGLKPMTESFLEFLRRYPGLRIVAAHMLFADLPLDRWGELLEKYPGLYLDTTNTLSLLTPGTGEEKMFSALLKGYSHRMVFGTDYPMAMDYPVENLFQLVHKICPGQEYIEDLCWRTAVKIVGAERFHDTRLLTLYEQK